jgi:predicted adenine nucleotide alpha hydrolase (AANH) superfamily ATPase
MKSISALIVQENTILIDKKHSSRILLNDEADINVINYRYAEILDMMLIVNDFSKSSHVKKKSMHCYDVYLMKSRLFDNWEQKRVFEAVFYAIDKNDNIDMILSMSELHHIKAKLDYAALSWRYEFAKQAFQINFVS